MGVKDRERRVRGPLGSRVAFAIRFAARPLSLTYLPTTAATFVPGYEASSWHGIAAPKNAPADESEKWNNVVRFSSAKVK